MRKLQRKRTKNNKFKLLLMLLLLLVTISSCGNNSSEADSFNDEQILQDSENRLDEELDEIQEAEQPNKIENQVTEQDSSVKIEQNELQENNSDDVDEVIYSIEDDSTCDIPEYFGEPYVAINNNIPFFEKEKLPTESFEYYSDLDELGRCGLTCANVGQDIMPTEKRKGIGQIQPSGWDTIKYDNIDGNYLYNRCHLIGFQLTGENANEKNLITGTRYMNTEGMLPFENMVADYVKETGNHVMYRVAPIFDGNDLLASGVIMEGWSVEDKGEGICFNVYVYNVQPGIIINYANGDSQSASETSIASETQKQKEIPPTQTQTDTQDNSEIITQAPQEPIVAEQPMEPVPSGTDYVLNTNSKKFHYPYCSSVDQMSEKNKQFYNGNRDEIISMGYEPCKRCNP